MEDVVAGMKVAFASFHISVRTLGDQLCCARVVILGKRVSCALCFESGQSTKSGWNWMDSPPASVVTSADRSQ